MNKLFWRLVYALLVVTVAVGLTIAVWLQVKAVLWVLLLAGLVTVLWGLWEVICFLADETMRIKSNK